MIAINPLNPDSGCVLSVKPAFEEEEKKESRKVSRRKKIKSSIPSHKVRKRKFSKKEVQKMKREIRKKEKASITINTLKSKGAITLLQHLIKKNK